MFFKTRSQPADLDAIAQAIHKVASSLSSEDQELVYSALLMRSVGLDAPPAEDVRLLSDVVKALTDSDKSTGIGLAIDRWMAKQGKKEHVAVAATLLDCALCRFTGELCHAERLAEVIKEILDVRLRGESER